MQDETFRALVLRKEGDAVHAQIERLPVSALPPGDVLVRVAFSDLNYKDGMSVKGVPGVVRSYPMIPGIDLAGTVVESGTPRFQAGDRVVATGFGLAERHWGGYTQLERVSGDMVVKLPADLTLQDAMAIGTAGLTAMLAVMALEEHGLAAERGEVLVTGAGGGVGSVAVAILAYLGYQVVASTGRSELHGYLRQIGAHRIVSREDVAAPSERPLDSARWAGVVDTVGGETLAAVLRAVVPGGSVAACGNAGGNELQTTVLPFILRGVNLLGIDSNYCSLQRRETAWQRLAKELPPQALQCMTESIGLEQVPEWSERILNGQVRGRTVVDVNR